MTLLEHFSDQPDCGQRFGNERQAVEENRVPAFHKNRQDWRLGGISDFDKATMPRAILDALGAKTGYFTRRKYNQCALIQQMLADV